MLEQVWQLQSRSTPELYTEHWQQRLAQMLGYRPRRVSFFAQSAMYGALDCLSQIPYVASDELACIRMMSLHGAKMETIKAVEVSETELPMPFTFLQSQMSQALVALVAALKWQGDASIVISEHFNDFAHMALLQSKHQSLLLGCADELHDAASSQANTWFYLVPCALPMDAQFDPVHIQSPHVRYWKLDAQGLSGSL